MPTTWRPSRPPVDPVAAFARKYIKVVPGWRDLFGIAPTWESVLERIRQYPISQLLLHVGHINAALSKSADVQSQAQLCSELFAPDGAEIWGRLVRFANTPELEEAELTLFHPAQTLLLAKVALTHQSSDFSTPCESLRPLAEALLMISDLAGSSQPNTLEHAAAMITASSLFHRVDVPTHGLARSVELYLTDWAELQDHPDYVNLPAELRRITGLEPDLLWLLLLALYGRLQAVPVTEFAHPFNVESFFNVRGDLVDDKEAAPIITPDEAARLARHLRATIPEFATLIRDSGFILESARLYDLAEFAEFPFIHHESKDICLSQELLVKKLIDGVHYLFLSRDKTTHAERNRYLRFRGAVFERYVDRILQRCFLPGNGFYTGLMSPPQVGNRRVRCCDAAWASGDALVLLEIKGKQLDVQARMGVRERLEQKYEELFFDSAMQLDSTIRAFKAGDLVIDGVEPAQVTRFFPIIVTLENLTMEPLTHRFITEELSRRSLLLGPETRPLQLLNVADLEILEAGLGRGLKLLHILAKKQDLDVWRGASFKNFFLHQYPSYFKDIKNSHLVSVFERQTDRALAQFEARRHAQR